MELDLAALMPFAKLVGLEITEANPNEVRGRLVVRADLCTTGNIMHGGAIMSVADTMGAVAAFLNLPEGASGTTTIESKTNFLGAAPEGAEVVAVTQAVKAGRRISVWRTTLSVGDKTVAEVTQSQLVL